LFSLAIAVASKLGALKVCDAVRLVKRRSSMMKALAHHGPGKGALEDKPKPTAKEPTDARTVGPITITGNLTNY
jgi:hypothetical protein